MEKSEMMRFNFWIEKSKVKKLKYIALEKNTTVSQILNTFVDTFIEERENND